MSYFHRFFNASFNHTARCVSIGFVTLLIGCVNSAPPAPPSPTVALEGPQSVSSYYDYQLRSPHNQPITLQEFVRDIKDADVVLVGEWHSHAGIHRFQTDLLQAMFQQSPQLALSMEQFTRENQIVVDHYLAGYIGEQTLIELANAWPNYESDYRPLVEFAKAQKLDIIAANAPKDIVRCIGREGIGYIDRLPANERGWVADTISTQDSAYKRHFMASMHHGDEQQNDKQFAAQVTWDETMAESIVRYLDQHPGNRVMHIAGKFHIENGLGTAAGILARVPHLKVVVVTPVSASEVAEKASGDYHLQVITPPKRFVKKEHMMAAFKTLSERSKKLECIKK